MSANELNAKLSESNLYRGNVKLSIIDNSDNTIVSSRTIHNNGCQNLFKFFANAVAGDWATVKNQIPCKIKLFEHDTDEDIDDYPGTATWDKCWAEKLEASPSVYYDAANVVEEVSDVYGNAYGYKTTLHFRIPFTYIKSGNTLISKVALYPSIITDNTTSMLAYFKSIKEGDWDPIEIPENANSFTLIIEWSLIIQNA